MFKKLSRPTFPTLLLLLVLGSVFCSAFLTELLPLPRIIMLFVDVSWAMLLLLLIKNAAKFADTSTGVKILVGVVLAFFLNSILSFLFAGQSMLYYAWGLRNNLCFFVFFFGCVLFLPGGDIPNWLQALDILFWVHVLAAIFQFVVLGKSQDFLGGIFGTSIGCNAFANVFQMVIVTRSILRYFNHEESTLLCLSKCGAALVVAALGEIKVFFFEFAAIALLAMLFTRFSKRKIVLLAGGAVGIVLAILLLDAITPGWASWFRPSRIWAYVISSGGYTGSGDMNRMTAIPLSWSTFLQTLPQKLFGLGLGNCDSSPLSFLTSPFYIANACLRYNWFTSSMIMLETGLIGTLLYLSFFVVIFFSAFYQLHEGSGNPLVCQMAMVLAPMCLVLFLFDSSLRTEPAYMMYFALALPFVKSQDK